MTVHVNFFYNGGSLKAAIQREIEAGEAQAPEKMTCKTCGAQADVANFDRMIRATPHEVGWDVLGIEDGCCPHCRPALPREESNELPF
jgi:hypothetical protein